MLMLATIFFEKLILHEFPSSCYCGTIYKPSASLILASAASIFPDRSRAADGHHYQDKSSCPHSLLLSACESYRLSVIIPQRINRCQKSGSVEITTCRWVRTVRPTVRPSCSSPAYSSLLRRIIGAHLAGMNPC